jgi:hypothetical protein
MIKTSLKSGKLTILALLFSLCTLHAQESDKATEKRMQWFEDAKLGILHDHE